MDNVSVGQRVRIGFTRTYAPSVGAARSRAALQGAVGHVERVDPLTGLVLVRLDAKPQPWPGNPAPGDGWWLVAADIVPAPV